MRAGAPPTSVPIAALVLMAVLKRRAVISKYGSLASGVASDIPNALCMHALEAHADLRDPRRNAVLAARNMASSVCALRLSPCAAYVLSLLSGILAS